MTFVKRFHLYFQLVSFIFFFAGDFCSGKPDGNHPNPDRCDQFYQCSGGGGIVQTCSSGTVYDRNLGICNWPDQVDPDDLCEGCPNDANYC